LVAAGAGGGGGAGFGTGAGAVALAAAWTAGIAEGGMFLITGLGERAADAAGLSPGLASSSAMMRRIDAQISSIEGSWPFAGCVISDSTSSTNLPPSDLRFAGSENCGPAISWNAPDLSPDQTPAADRCFIPCSVMTPNHDGRATNHAPRIASPPRTRL